MIPPILRGGKAARARGRSEKAGYRIHTGNLSHRWPYQMVGYGLGQWALGQS
jgi:hypothetical protein